MNVQKIVTLRVSTQRFPCVRNQLEANLDCCGKSGQMVSEARVIDTSISVEPPKQKKIILVVRQLMKRGQCRDLDSKLMWLMFS